MKIKIKNGKWEYNMLPYNECTELEKLIWNERYRQGILPTTKPKEKVLIPVLFFAGVVMVLLYNFNKLM